MAWRKVCGSMVISGAALFCGVDPGGGQPGICIPGMHWGLCCEAGAASCCAAANAGKNKMQKNAERMNLAEIIRPPRSVWRGVFIRRDERRVDAPRPHVRDIHTLACRKL